MSIALTPLPTATPPAMQITISGSTGVSTTVYRNDPDGRVRVVRAGDPATLTTGAATVLDYEAPYGQAVTYTHVPATGTTETSTSATLGPAGVWLIHPGVPALSVGFDPSEVTALEDRTRSARSAVLQPMGRATPVVVSETRSAPQAGISVYTSTLTRRDAMWALLAAGSTLLLNIPAALGWGVTWEYISVGDVTENYVAGSDPTRLFALPYTVVDRPVGAQVVVWTYSGILASTPAYNTYADVYAAYDNYTAVIANTP